MQQSSVVSFSNLGKIESFHHFPSAAVPATASEYPSHQHLHHHHQQHPTTHSPILVKSEYSPPTPSAHHPTVNMAKRALSDSDCDDLFSDTKESCMTPPGSDTGASISRKKRRGIIEKRRRDRINNSLTELRRLVPTAFEKQGSAKLEKAEILQMTVDHLRMLHSKGLDALAYDPHKFAMDYHSIGFRECAAEVARYLVTVEGMDIQDPLRLRLMSHLQCFAAQRELANKQASASSWGLNPLNPNHSYPIPTHHHLTNSTNTGGLPVAPPLQPGQHPSLMEATSPATANHGNYLNSTSNHTSPTMPNDPLGNNNNSNQLSASHPGGHHHANAMGATANAGGVHQRSPLFPAPSGGNHHHASHHLSAREYSPNLGTPAQHPTSNANPMTSSPYGMTQANAAYQVQAGNKPYRPWGAELAY